MPRQSSIDRNLCCLLGSCLSDKNDIWIMPENCLESNLIGISFTIIDLRLLDAFDLIFDRIFERNDLSFSIIQRVQYRI